MPRLEYFIVSQSCAVDRLTNQVSLFNVIESVQTTLPLMFPELVAVTAWNQNLDDEEQDLQATLRVTVPGTEEPAELRTNFSMKNPRHRTFQRIQGLFVPRPGELVFELLLNDVHQATHTVLIQQVEGQVGGPAQQIGPPPSEEE